MNNDLSIKRVLVLGASGMLGNAVLRFFLQSPGYVAFGSVRTAASMRFFPQAYRQNVIAGVDVENIDNLMKVFSAVNPTLVINCIGLVKQIAEADDPLTAIPINSLLPHRLAKLCDVAGARFVHLSTDCVFSGDKGMYLESDAPDATDLYGRSKYLGEVDCPCAITIRTSIIGHELDGSRSLIGWFLSQDEQVKGFRQAIFSGLPTVEIARIIRDHIVPNPDLHGLYHVSADPISKFDLLSLAASVYKKDIEIVPDDSFIIDRSLDSSRFRVATGFKPKPWTELVQVMKDFG